MTLKQFFRECHQREVFKMLSIYIVTSWVILQVLSVTYEPLNLPEKSVTYLILILIVGLPVYIFLIWESRLKSKEVPDDADEIKSRKIFERFYFTGLGIVSFFSAMSVLLIVNSAFGTDLNLPETNVTDKIAVLKFENATGDESFDLVTKTSLNWIEHSITESKAGQVITHGDVEEYTDLIRTQSKSISEDEVLNRYFQPSKKVTGSIFLIEDQLIFKSSILDGSNGETLISFKQVECDKDSPFECIEELQQKILGFLITEERMAKSLELNPPNYEAYKYFTEAKDNFDNKPLHLELLNKTIAADSSYFEPQAYKILYYYNQREFKTFDSLLEFLPRTGISNRQRNMISHYESLRQGDHSKAYSTVIAELELNPFDLRTNQTVMTIALQMMNKPEDVEPLFNEIDMADFDISNCPFCVFRYYTMAVAFIELKEYYKAIDLIEEIIDQSEWPRFKKPLMAAYVRTNNFEDLNALIDKMKFTEENEEWVEANIYAGREILLKGSNPELANLYFDNVLAETVDQTSEQFGRVSYHKGDFLFSEKIYSQLVAEEPTNLDHLTKLAVSQFKNGKNNAAEATMAQINGLRTDFQYGKVDYAIAQIYASRGENDIAIEHLMMSIADGNRYRDETFKNDYHLKDLMNTPGFERVMSFWK